VTHNTPAKVVSISTGDRAGVLARRDALVEAHLDLVRTTAERVKRSLPPSFDLEDLEGVGRLALLHAATAYRPEAHNDTPFDAFARKRIHGAMIDSVRRSKYTENTRPGLDSTPDVPVTPDVVESIDAGRRRVEMNRAVQTLAPRHRKVIQMHYDEGKTLAEVAVIMGCSPSLASNLHCNALAELRERLAAA
jgi:RNA polymerase sigma factor (sigma-70 family)